MFKCISIHADRWLTLYILNAPTPHHTQERHPDLQAEQEACAAEYRAAAKAVKREQERQVRVFSFYVDTLMF